MHCPAALANLCPLPWHSSDSSWACLDCVSSGSFGLSGAILGADARNLVEDPMYPPVHNSRTPGSPGDLGHGLALELCHELLFVETAGAVGCEFPEE